MDDCDDGMKKRRSKSLATLCINDAEAITRILEENLCGHHGYKSLAGEYCPSLDVGVAMWAALLDGGYNSSRRGERSKKDDCRGFYPRGKDRRRRSSLTSSSSSPSLLFWELPSATTTSLASPQPRGGAPHRRRQGAEKRSRKKEAKEEEEEVLLFEEKKLNKSNARHQNSYKKMLAPPTPTGANNSLWPPGRDQRSNSCLSDTVTFLVPPGAAEAQSRRPSAYSVGANGAGGGGGPLLTLQPSTGSRRGSKAYLIRERASGDEVVVTLSPIRAPVVGAKTIISKAPPTFMAGAKFVSPITPLPTSLDDEDVAYNSLMTRNDFNRRFSEAVNAEDVIAANRLQKVYQQYRKQAHANSDETMATTEERLNEWLRERDRRLRRKSCAVGEFASQAAARSKSPGFYAQPHQQQQQQQQHPPSRTERAHSYAIAVPSSELHLARAGSKRSTKSARVCCDNTKEVSRKTHSASSLQKQHKEHLRPTRSYDHRGDIETAAAILREEEARQMLRRQSRILQEKNGLVASEDVPPPEKERKRAVLIVSCVALAITIFAASLVGLTLGLSHLLEDLSSSSSSVASATSNNGEQSLKRSKRNSCGKLTRKEKGRERFFQYLHSQRNGKKKEEEKRNFFPSLASSFLLSIFLFKAEVDHVAVWCFFETVLLLRHSRGVKSCPYRMRWKKKLVCRCAPFSVFCMIRQKSPFYSLR